MEPTPYSVLIIEDEYPARMLMMDYVLNCPELKLAGIAESGDKANTLINEKKFDLVFMDINLPVVNGMDILRSNHSKSTFFIITTAYSEHAVEAFDLDATDYLLKPFSFERFRKSVEKALRFLQESKQNNSNENLNKIHLKIQSDSAVFLLPYPDIQFISANNKSCVIHTTQKDYETPKLLKEIEEKLPTNQFVRIHKGFLVNLSYVASLRYDKGGSYTIQLKNEDETTLPVGRSYAQSLKEALKL
ncbi:DNA-binding response regulator [Leptospira biflexa]|jgi:two-component system response regulator LytT|uniref:Putative two-component response regulator n=1 Tax=Leptospira biflexa serovar Patoc (strain Patoc 1 / ATCC 23582 / Paris) TaxID=456481 RepID=B0SPH3_LEPBP|nr:LytTR family DNA-binding domain-containing protein [Leptospira biflexa]ABZ95383.1 Response regulator [Leptospira biflexa serovar Patoc strain 'Patoc 1 (Ames)']ABZ99079.1 Putative two-component response regulator [Leptospira biflexa serovar Patoc strain 'Patoc 1 (Paris)']TGM31927.1 DNA-binding response regulator [Leptospira biflexa]TGM37068.1 DNA-binding response regulator [Leptospira biflexa]TGM46613.1 DNA-binding response regulator [Leptospira biflexa]